MKKRTESRPAKPGAGPDSMIIDVTLRVNHLKPMRKFYEELLGFKVLGEFPSAALLRMDGGGSGQMLGLLQRSVRTRSGINTPSRIIFKLSVPSEVAKEHLESLGLRVNAVREGSRRSLRVRDPEGNDIELIGRDTGPHE